MSGKDTITERLAQIVPTCMDGELWYEAQRVYQAFRLDPRKAAREIRKEYKRREFRYVRGWRSYNTYYLHRKGVETLAILYGQQPGPRSWLRYEQTMNCHQPARSSNDSNAAALLSSVP